MTDTCARCGGSGLDPEQEGECGECSLPCCRNEGEPPEEHSQSCPVFGTRALLEKLRFAAEDVDKWFVKARVYGAISAKYNETLLAIVDTLDGTSNTARGLARSALQWRHSVKGGVPMSAVEAIGELLCSDASLEVDRLRGELARAKAEVEARVVEFVAKTSEQARLDRIRDGAMGDIEREGAKLEIAELKKRIENGMATHREDKMARAWLAREKERLEAVIRTGGAMYRAERAAMGIPGGIDPDEVPR